MARAHEDNFREVVDPQTVSTRFMPGSQIELIDGFRFRQTPRHVLFDFDGTLSLVREGWPDIMIPMMVELLEDTGTTESRKSLTQTVRRFVMELNGKQTIYQMIRLAEEIASRGGAPLEPFAYKAEYHARLMARIEFRREALLSGKSPAEAMLVPGSLALLSQLQSRGLMLYLASGTDENYVKEEVRLLGLDRFFGERVYGALSDYRSFSKAQVIDRILNENAVEGSALLGFGDGYVEIQNVREVGGTAVAVASDEANRSGRPDAWKRERLIGAGANIVIPDYQEADRLLAYLLDGKE
jgi:phosphoglycolate phosphatase